MIPGRSERDTATVAAMLCAAAMIAQQVGAKATRDALFLSSFGPEALPSMVMASAFGSIGFVLLAGRLLAWLGPARMVPLAFAVSGVLLIGAHELERAAPRAGAVAVYLHVASFGSVLISLFWSLVAESFDPRTAKRRVAWIASAATLGGVLGGIAAERVAVVLDVRRVLLLLAVLHLVCAVSVRRLRSSAPAQRRSQEERPASALRLLRSDRYLRSIGMLVVALALGVALLDYTFKTQAVAAYGTGAPLLRFFAAFYTVTGLLAFFGQLGLSRLALERLGLAHTISSLPLSLAAGGVLSLLAPGLGSAVGLRGLEAIVRACLYRPAYELLYTPVPPAEKRSTKTLVDVALERIGEILGGLTLRLVLSASAPSAIAVLSGLVSVLGVAALVVARGLHQGYVRALERSLLSRAVELDPSQVLDHTTRSVLLVTHTQVPLPSATPHSPAPVMGAADPLETGLFVLTASAGAEAGASPQPPATAGAPAAPASVPAGPPADPLLARLAELRSGDAARVAAALKQAPLERTEAAHAIALLAWNEVSGHALEALRAAGPRIVGQLLDSLLDPEEEFAVRRRLPRVLAAVPAQRAVEGLLRGLEDRRFEVRFECARALARIHLEQPGLEISAQRVFDAVLRETAVRRELWLSRRLLDGADAGGGEWALDERLRGRAARSLEHAFTLLSLALPSEPLRVAFRSLHTGDPGLRGTALEYLESVLPASVRDALWPFLEPERTAMPPPARSRQEILDTLMRSSAEVDLELARQRAELGGGS
jgi:MFS family permease